MARPKGKARPDEFKQYRSATAMMRFSVGAAGTAALKKAHPVSAGFDYAPQELTVRQAAKSG
jgi:hypothetical protein